MVSSINARVRANLIKSKDITRKQLHAVARYTLLEIGYRLVMRSPVGDPASWKPPIWPKGYKPGHFINNWHIGIDVPSNATTNKVDPTGSGSLARLSKVGRWPAGHVYFFCNNLPYARALEYGWSKQAPRGMVRLTMLDYKSIVATAVQRVKSEGV